MNVKKLISAVAATCMMLGAVSNVYAVNTPTLKYSNAGAFYGWTEESYYSSPVVVDLESDGSLEIVYSSYSINVLDAATGGVKWRVNSGRDRATAHVEVGGNVGYTWSDIEVIDIDGDGSKEIISVHNGGCLSVLDSNGYFKAGFPQYPTTYPLRSLEVADLDNDGTMEIIVGAGIDSPKSVWVYEHNGVIRSGWPQLDASQDGEINTTDYQNNGWGYGVFGDGIKAGDIDNDGFKEIIVPTDTSFVSAFEADGRLCKANAQLYGGRTWAKVPFYEDYQAELRMDNEGWGNPVVGGEYREDLYKAEMGHAGTAIYDVDKDGKNEVIVTGIMANRKYGTYPPTEYMTMFIVNGDRSRFKNDYLGYDWTKIPTDLGAPLIQNQEIICSNVMSEPVVEDIDGNGTAEILFSSYNGKMHCFSLDGTEPNAWPYALTRRTSPKFEYASTPVCIDIDFDGTKEVIFTSWYDKNQSFDSIMNGSLYILNCYGNLISKTELPASKEGVYNNGAMASPTVADVDGDGAYEVVINTLYGAVCVYDL